MFCNKCGNEIKEGQKFCTKCGTPVTDLNSTVKKQEKSEKKLESKREEKPVEQQVIKPVEAKPVEKTVPRPIEQTAASKQPGQNYQSSIKTKKNNKGIFILLAIVLVCAAGFFVKKQLDSKGKFVKKGGREVYIEDDIVIKNQEVTVGNKVYYLDSEGQKVKNDWRTNDSTGKWMYFDTNGEKVINAVKSIDGKLFAFDQDGEILTGDFELDGKTYHADENGSILRNILTKDGNKLYFYDDEGVKSTKAGWIENRVNGSMPSGKYYINDDNTYIVSDWKDDCYLTANGTMAINQWVGDYHVGNDGKKERNKWVGEYYCGEDGAIVKNKWVDDYYCGSDGKYLKNTYTADGKYVGADGKVTEPPKVVQTSAATQRATQNAGGNTSTEVVEPSTANHDGAELYIIDTGTIREEYETKGGNSCKVTVIRPTIAGVDLDEGDIFNDGVGEAIDQLLEELEEYVGNSSTEYKTITFTKAEMTTLTSSRARITLSGKIYPKSGSSKTIKYRITYDRENETCELEKINS